MHSSKTMRQPAASAAPGGSQPTDAAPGQSRAADAAPGGSRAADAAPGGSPVLLERAEELVAYLRTLSQAQISRVMSVSADLAAKTRQQYADWSADPARQTPAAATFVGDIYSGLQVDSFTPADRRYADAHLRILSGLYGLLRPFDGVSPYRLEMGYRLPPGRYANLYRFWGTSIAERLPAEGHIVNLAAKEYSRVVLPHVAAERVLTPRFLTLDAASGRPKFVVVHAKIARGAFARWLVTRRVSDPGAEIGEFGDLGYRYDEASSTPSEPTFVCREFGGKGLSVRRT